MPHVDFRPSYQILLSNDEFRVVCLALAGMLKDPQDIESALVLNKHLLAHKVSHMTTTLEQAEKALERAESLAAPVETRKDRHSGTSNR